MILAFTGFMCFVNVCVAVFFVFCVTGLFLMSFIEIVTSGLWYVKQKWRNFFRAWNMPRAYLSMLLYHVLHWSGSYLWMKLAMVLCCQVLQSLVTTSSPLPAEDQYPMHLFLDTVVLPHCRTPRMHLSDNRFCLSHKWNG